MVQINYTNHLQGMVPLYSAFIKIKTNVTVKRFSKSMYVNEISMKLWYV